MQPGQRLCMTPISSWREDLFGLTISSQPENMALEQNQMEFYILILSVLLSKLSNSNSFLN